MAGPRRAARPPGRKLLSYPGPRPRAPLDFRLRTRTIAASLEGLDRTAWSEYAVSARGNRITLELNGRRTVDYTEMDPAIEREGFIALQVHSGPRIEVRFKDILIAPL